MSSAGINFGGLASGLDTQAIIRALVAVERRPINQLEAKKSTLGKQKSLIGDLDTLLDKLKDKAKTLKTTSDFLKMKVTSDDEDILTATAGSNASPGTHTVKVHRLASAQVNSTTGSASSSAAIGSWGEFTLGVGGQQLPITLGGATIPSLDSVAAAINDQAASSDLKIRAEVVDTGSTTNRFQLVVRSTETGVAGAFSITDIDGDGSFATVMNDLVANRRTEAQDADIELNGGIHVFRSTNSITGAIPGVTLDLKASDATKTVHVTISTDATETAKKVKEFVDAYNEVVDYFATQNKLGEDGKAKSPLFGDVTLRSIRSNLRNVLGTQVTNSGNEAYQLLVQLGITADTQGKLTFNQSKLEEALADDEQAVAKVFTDATQGIAKKMETAIGLYTDSIDGLLKSRTDGFDRQVKQTQRRIDDGERRIEQYQKQLETKYANLETLLTRLQGQGSSVGNIASGFSRSSR